MAAEPPVVADPGAPEFPSVGDRRWSPVAHRLDLVLVGLVVAYVVARSSVALRVEPFRTYDSRSYLGLTDGPDPTVTLSFTGQAPRLWGAPLLYSLVGADEGRALLQALVGMLGWTALVVALWITLRSPVARVLAAVVLFGLALTPPAYVWDHTMISESLSINLGLLTVGLGGIWWRTRSRVAAAAMTATAFWWIFTRQDMLLFVGLVLVAVLVLAWRSRPHRRAAVAVVLVLGVGLAWAAAIAGPTDRTFARWSASGHSQTEETFLYRLMIDVMDDRRMREVYHEELGMPGCRPLEKVTDSTSWNVRRVGHAYRACPDLRAWADENKMTVGYRYAVADPRHFARTMEEKFAVALGSRSLGTYGRPAALLPAGVQAAYFPPERLVLPLVAVTAVLAVLAGWATGAVRRRRVLLVAGAVAVVGSLVSTLAGLMLSAGEFARFGIQESLYLRIGLLVLLLAALDAALDRRGRAGQGDAPGPRPSPAIDGE
ncbi:hypothetical protein [Micromonospora sp. NPDC049497]|uniref:hypothetical protein n=1 Tax=Micromonospora sp. NPDC049497 TaxID=3364273 RepID=UPI0037AB30E9